MRFDTSGGLCSLDEHLQRAQFFEVLHAGAVVARYALAIDGHAHGVEAVIVGAVGGLPGFDLTASVLPHIEAQVKGVRAVKVETRRRALVKKLMQRGYVIDAYVLRKRFTDD